MRRLVHRLAALAASATFAACAAQQPPAQVRAFTSSEQAILANAYLIETPQSVILVDATLTETSSLALREMLDATGKPLAAVVITHGHPDHYNGLTNILGGRDIPVYATEAVARVIRDNDAAKERQWSALFGPEWPARRTFPNRAIAEGDSVAIDGVTLTVHAHGAAESDADTVWTADLGGGERVAFIGDLAFNGVHAYTCDGHTGEWLAALDRLEAQASAEQWRVLYPGHGAAGGAEMLRQQRRYLEVLRARVAELGADGELAESDITSLQQSLETETPARGLDFLVANCAPAVLAELNETSASR